MNQGSTAGRLSIGLAVAALLGGCAAGASPTPAPASSSPAGTPSAAVATPTLAPTATATPAPTPASFGPVTVVTGTATCPGMDWNWTTDLDGTQHVRDGHSPNGCTVVTNDPRVSGHRTSTWNMDLWANPTTGTGALVEWGTPRLENAGGTWRGRATSVASLPGRGDIMVNWYKGTGDYTGLAYFELWTGVEPWKIQGQVFPGDPPPPYAKEATGTGRPEAGGPVADNAVAVVTGTATCPTADLGKATTDAGGVQYFREVDFRCTMRTDDPRVSGTHTSGAWNIDWWGEADLSSGALVQWGTPRLENAGGTWEGTGSGVYSSDRGDIIAFWYRGIGAYAGLAYFELWTGQEPWTIQGQIFPGDPPTP
jgi:hypothetical protein